MNVSLGGIFSTREPVAKDSTFDYSRKLNLAIFPSRIGRSTYGLVLYVSLPGDWVVPTFSKGFFFGVSTSRNSSSRL
jgi:hypothetical protein